MLGVAAQATSELATPPPPQSTQKPNVAPATGSSLESGHREGVRVNVTWSPVTVKAACCKQGWSRRSKAKNQPRGSPRWPKAAQRASIRPEACWVLRSLCRADHGLGGPLRKAWSGPEEPLEAQRQQVAPRSFGGDSSQAAES